MVKGRSVVIFFFFFAALLISIPIRHTFAQENETEPDFIVTLALMAVADDCLDNVLDTSDLSNLRQMVDDYYKGLPYSQLDENNANKLRQEKSLILASLDSKIDKQKYMADRSVTALFLAMADGHDPNVFDYKGKPDPDEGINFYQLFLEVISGTNTQDPAIVALLNDRLEKDSQNTLQKDLDGHIAVNIEDGDQIIANTSDDAYDFSAGLSKEDYLGQLNQTKPLEFINNGSRPVNVSIEYYAPLKGVSISAPGFSVQVPGEKAVIASGFPQGNYTFCADWQTEMDKNGDGIKDYDRMVTHIWLSSAHSSDPNSPAEVYVNSVSSATPSGRCDGFKGEAPSSEVLMTEIFMTESDPEGAVIVPTDMGSTSMDGENIGGESTQSADFWGQDGDVEGEGDIIPTTEAPPPSSEGGGFNLTSAEQANQGQHNYQMLCETGDFVNTTSFSASFIFTADGVTLNGENFYARVSPNVYRNDFPTTITFMTNGYLTTSYYLETNSEGETTVYPTNCTATIQ